jgi:hypothetical protein
VPKAAGARRKRWEVTPDAKRPTHGGRSRP